MAPRACAAMALTGFAVAAAGFALAGSTSAAGIPVVSVAVALVGFLAGAVAAARWLRTTAPRREWDRRR